eukprot:TRINITY_DN13577_c1_g2_i1.p1 TRINITY_DN13577_c1_g2~~TRINITY_DN13577_c1_g2_i1.p1  ORF type:complete len:1070 (+),score=162.73 TRINITY_DN13577_c1_g2_i1:55-3264(+)
MLSKRMQLPLHGVLDQHRRSITSIGGGKSECMSPVLGQCKSECPSPVSRTSAKRSTLQMTLPPELAAKFEKHQKTAEARTQKHQKEAETRAEARKRSKSCDEPAVVANAQTRRQAVAKRRQEQGGRAMYDKRTLRKMHKKEFAAAIEAWHGSRKERVSRPCAETACHVSVRLRPMFEKEGQQGDFEVVSVKEDRGEVVVHTCGFHADLIRMHINHCGFYFPRVFGPDASNDMVYTDSGAPLVQRVSHGQLSTLFMFGQTGSGKTHTLTSILHLAAQDLFKQAQVVRVKAFEIAGKKCLDLLSKQRVELKLLDDAAGHTQVVGVEEVDVDSAETCLATLQKSLSRRAKAGHGRNDESSRSHYVCMLSPDGSQGSLVLVDCAGTERRQDCDQHTAERMAETAETNASLHALKECIRYRMKEQRSQVAAAAAKHDDRDDATKHVHVPYRGSQLTRVLHESFTRPDSYLAVMGTVSPIAMDTEHTMSTLKTLHLLSSEARNSDAPSFEEKTNVEPQLKTRTSSPSKLAPAGRPQPPASTLRKTQSMHLPPGGMPRCVLEADSKESPSPAGLATEMALRQTVASLSARVEELEKALQSKEAQLDSLRTVNRELRIQNDESERKRDDLEKERRRAKLDSTPSLEDALARLSEAEARIKDLEVGMAEAASKQQEAERLFLEEQARRRRCHNDLLDMKGQIRVFCRIRPLLEPKEADEQAATSWKDVFTTEVSLKGQSVDGNPRNETHTYSFDSVFAPSASQREVFAEVEGLVQSTIDGYNVTVLAYGQTGAGKTYTIYGGEKENRGIAPRIAQSIFAHATAPSNKRCAFKVCATMVELYKDRFIDLLVSGKAATASLDVKCDLVRGDAVVEGAVEREVTRPDHLMQLIDDGLSRRNVAKTLMNSESSRSHLFLTITIEVADLSTETCVKGKMVLCDLAGSERLKKSGAVGEVMKETIEINKSLTALADVIEALAKDSKCLVPYRNHKLTQLLSATLGGSSKTLMFVNVSPLQADVEETMNSLTYASRARGITNDVRKPLAVSNPCATPKRVGRGKTRRPSTTMEDLGDSFIRNLRV